MDKRTKILECIILEYIKNPEPMGSEQLKQCLNIEISSATIRNHFKRLVDDGLLMQFHISGGRVPTFTALSDYWQQKLQPLQIVQIADMQRLDETSKSYKVPSVVRFEEMNRLVGVHSAGQKFLVLELENGEVVLRYDARLEQFLKEFIGIEASQLANLATHYGLVELHQKLEDLERQNITNIYAAEELIGIAQHDCYWAQQYFTNFLNGMAIDQFELGFFFERMVPSGYVVIKKDARIGDQNAHLLCIGHVSRDFNGFFAALN